VRSAHAESERFFRLPQTSANSCTRRNYYRFPVATMASTAPTQSKLAPTIFGQTDPLEHLHEVIERVFARRRRRHAQLGPLPDLHATLDPSEILGVRGSNPGARVSHRSCTDKPWLSEKFHKWRAGNTLSGNCGQRIERLGGRARQKSTQVLLATRTGSVGPGFSLRSGRGHVLACEEEDIQWGGNLCD